MKTIKDFPFEKIGSFRQEKALSCGPAAVKIVLRHIFGRIIPEKQIRRASLFIPSWGTTHWGLLWGFRWIVRWDRVTVKISSKTSLDLLADEIKNDRAPICIIMITDGVDPLNPHSTWKPEDPISTYPHYVVVVGIDQEQNKVLIANPFGCIHEMSSDDFMERFYLADKHLESDNKKLSRLWKALKYLRLMRPGTAIIYH